MIKNVIMDMGNVLLDYNPMVVINRVLEKPEDKELIFSELFRGDEWKQNDLGNMDSGRMYELVKQRVPKRLHEALWHCVNEWDICMVPLDGARDFTDYVKECGYQIYVLSNAGKKFYDYFERFAPFDYFNGIMISSDVHIVKPDIGIYKRFLEEFALEPGECLFIDDNKDNVEGARKLGINAVVFEENFKFIAKNFLHQM